MKITPIVTTLVATALASVHATGLVGVSCPDGTPEPTTLMPSPTTPEPTTAGPTTPSPTKPTTLTPSPTTPSPTTPGPSSTTSSPTTPAPTTPNPTTPGPSTPGPTVPGPTTPSPTTPGPTTPSPTISTPTPTSADPSTPSPTTPSPTTPSPTTTAPPPAPVDCVLYDLVADPSPWSVCVDDGSGAFYQTKILGIQTSAQFGGKECLDMDDPRRTVKQLCRAQDCVVLTPEEDQQPYGDCYKDDVTGKYIKAKVLGIKTEAMNGGTCDPKKRWFSVPCAAIDCVWNTPEEDTGPFGECQDDGTGTWFKSRVLGIKTQAQYGGTECVSPSQRTQSVLCQAENCEAVAPEDDKGEFGPCVDDGTGTWFKSKVLGIKTPAKNGGTCLPSDRLHKESCMAIDCVAYKTAKEDPGPFGECTDDGTGTFYRSKVLGIKVPAQYGGKQCDSVDARTVKQLCLAENCVALSPEEDHGPFGECTNDGTNTYYKFKVLGVQVPAKYGGTCLESDRIHEELCPSVDCVAFKAEEDTGPFGNCTDDGSGKYYKTKVLGIRVPAQYGGRECDPEDKRVVSEFCPPVKCVAFNVADDQGAYGECELDVVSGKWLKSKVLGVKEEAKNGGTCDPAERTVTAPCESVDCVVNTPDEDTGPLSACQLGDDGKYYRSKVLGIKKPAQYGGLCPSPAERTYSVLCPAVDCELVDPKDDTGPFGPCTKDNTNGLYYKSKLLAIKVSPQYGGTCLDSARLYQEQCLAIDCMAYTAETDPGVFGECTNDDSGKYYKSKVLQIKTYSQYGGKDCLPESARTVSEFCPPENCQGIPSEQDTQPFGECKNNGTNQWFKSKVLPIQVPAKNGGTCFDSDRLVSELCPAVDCIAYSLAEDPSAFGECKNDGSGKYFQSKVLGIKTPAQYGGKDCDSEDKRVVTQFCPPVDCVALNVADDQGPYGECQLNTTSGTYYKSKELAVKDQAKNGGKCDPNDRTVTAPCAGVDCVVNTPDEDTGPFSACQLGDDGKYYKSKVLAIKTPAQYGGLCPLPADRTYKVLCPAVQCTAVDPKDDTGPFGACVQNTTTGLYYKSKILAIKTPSQYGGTCLDNDRVYKEQCLPINCVAYTQADDPGQFGECMDNGHGKFYQSKILGIKTPTQYGGVDCAPPEQRRVFEFCQPVNCETVKPVDDKGPFGDCINDGTNTYYKSKLLQIKTPAKNGGTCLDSDRLYKEVCPAVPCVIYSQTEDPGPFGACTNDGTGKYYKTKTLGIKTPAQYGGSCPFATDPSRIYKVLCPAVDCVIKNAMDDTSPYGACALNASDSKYYRTKILPILVQSQNGGKACPSEADRTLKQECPTNGGYCLPTNPGYDKCIPQLAQCTDQLQDKVYEGYELELVTGLQLWECCDRCTNTAGCVAYSFTSKSNECSLKWKIDTAKNKSGVISSQAHKTKPSPCSFNQNGFNTLPLSNLGEVTTDSLVACCDACAHKSGCETFNLKNSRCELKGHSGLNLVLFGDGWRSGRVN